MGMMGTCGVEGKWTCGGWRGECAEWECIWSRMRIRGRAGALECGVCLWSGVREDGDD